jgi:hypothetical protein
MIVKQTFLDKILLRQSNGFPVTEALKKVTPKTLSAIFCKSFSPDLSRLKILLKSIIENNEDSLPVFVAVPYKEFSLFKRELSDETILIPEEEFVEARCFLNSP